jgi:putative ABC transport system permease protein
VQAQIDEDPNAGVYLLMEEDLHAEHIAQRKGMIEAFAYWIVGIMLFGAVVAALSTMYAAVAHRTREIATLRALGFANMPIVVALLIEAMLLALLGAAIGTGTV